ncbi:hypothetical protein HYW94_01240 [Candidatus Uhrbacteria bacterium]|nr:hypothetical protein [Candidatus Uhrbacteria bacterium]
MKKIFNTGYSQLTHFMIVVFAFFGFAYSGPLYASEKNSRQPLKVFLKNDCTILQEKSSIRSENIHTDRIGSELIDSFLSYEKKFLLLSNVCEFEISEEVMYNKDMAVEITMQNKKTEYRPRIFFWDDGKKKWIQKETLMNRQTNIVRADIHVCKGIVGVFADASDSYQGIGSWYRHAKYPNGSATNLFPLGTKLRVTNLENKKHTDVTVTSTWTNTNEKRVLDLVSTAFKKIAPLRDGLVRIRIEKLKDTS